MEDYRTSTSSQRLASTFDTIIEGPEADIAAIAVFRPEKFPTGRNRDIAVSVQELVYGSKATRVGTSSKKDRGSSEGLETHVLQWTSPKDKILVEKPKYFVRGPEEEFGPRKGQQPSGLSSSLDKQEFPSKSAKQEPESPKEQSEGQEKGKGKGKVQVEQALPTELQNSKERKDSHGQCVQYGKNGDGIEKKEEEIMSQSFTKKETF
ncbi:hypothetical protein O181_086327 [Austropuccinia psidii MF-1]|uniref:Uncharacterized protein n=1 Tax=Austropuccinia psidii MF-1 TaxID=1389203 RepID=A0A9Q3IMC4_9BASI|nr:hypothetical protein [Austropuccinia psidii MF-1]